MTPSRDVVSKGFCPFHNRNPPLNWKKYGSCSNLFYLVFEYSPERSATDTMNSRKFLGLGLRSFVDEGLVDVGDDATASNCGLDQGIKLFIPSNGQLQMSRSDTLHTQITGRITSQLKNLRAQIFANGSHVDCRCCSNATVTCHSNLEMTVYTSHRKLNITRKN